MHQCSCAHCGKAFTSKRSDARYCGADCRSLASQERRKAPVVPIKPETPGSLLTATLAELDAAGRTDTALGQAAVTLATRLDSRQDTGSSVAALVRELRTTMEQALDGAQVAPDRMDELKARRVARLHA